MFGVGDIEEAKRLQAEFRGPREPRGRGRGRGRGGGGRARPQAPYGGGAYAARQDRDAAYHPPPSERYNSTRTHQIRNEVGGPGDRARHVQPVARTQMQSSTAPSYGAPPQKPFDGFGGSQGFGPSQGSSTMRSSEGVVEMAAALRNVTNTSMSTSRHGGLANSRYADAAIMDTARHGGLASSRFTETTQSTRATNQPSQELIDFSITSQSSGDNQMQAPRPVPTYYHEQRENVVRESQQLQGMNNHHVSNKGSLDTGYNFNNPGMANRNAQPTILEERFTQISVQPITPSQAQMFVDRNVPNQPQPQGRRDPDTDDIDMMDVDGDNPSGRRGPKARNGGLSQSRWATATAKPEEVPESYRRSTTQTEERGIAQRGPPGSRWAS